MGKNRKEMKILNYEESQMKEALQAVRNGMTLAEASRTFNVPRTTLTYKHSGRYPEERKMGPATYLMEENEKMLIDWITESQKIGFPISCIQLSESVRKLVTELNIKTPFKNNKPGKKWLQLFLQRHPEISRRIPQTLTPPRSSITEERLNAWFEEIDQYIQENNLKDVISDPKRVFNADESAFYLSPQGSKVLSPRGRKNVYLVGNDEKDCLTVLFTASAAGMLPPPMIIFQYERLPSYIVSSIPQDWGIGRSESGWMCGPTFYEYMTNIFSPWLYKNNIPRPVIFFVDGHVSHLTFHVSQFCAKNEFILICLVPNSTHITQPMDVAVFRPLKAAWKNAVENFKSENNMVTIKKEHVGIILKKAIDSTDLTVTIANGFRTSGLFPFTRNGVDVGKLLCSSRKAKEISECSTKFERPPLLGDGEPHVQFIESIIGEEKVAKFKETIEKNIEWVEPECDKSLYNFYKKVYYLSTSNNKSDGGADLEEVSEMDTITTEKLPTLLETNSPCHISLSTTNEKENKEESGKTFHEMLPSPFKRSLCWPEETKEKKKIKKEKIPYVVSSTAYKEYYEKKLTKKKEEEQAKQKRKEERQKKKELNVKKKTIKKRKCYISSSSSEHSEDEISVYSDDESDDIEEFMREKKELQKELKNCAEDTEGHGNKEKHKTKTLRNVASSSQCENETDITVSSFVIVNYEGENFPGQVLKIEGDQYYVKAMRMSGYNWKWPASEDKCWYKQEDVLTRINVPQKVNDRGTFRVPEIESLRNMDLQ